ncbi:MAG: flagellar biosynthesis anti-sigma factor FlgM [Ectothiorhodospiraceae bacterium]|nr:flagellar biosynthesis anti-sigma factor FlgM [Ectothiorhodospiraceae bacterium]
MAVDITPPSGFPSVDNKLSTSKLPNQSTTEAAAGTSSKTAHSEPARIDSVSISQTAEQLRNIESNINMQPDIDHLRVETLKDAIDAGKYNIDPFRVAEKFIDFDTQFVA